MLIAERILRVLTVLLVLIAIWLGALDVVGMQLWLESPRISAPMDDARLNHEAWRYRSYSSTEDANMEFSAQRRPGTIDEPKF